ncbi:Uncharacterised protein [Yersinia mollaretii]|uniref:Uncharacterized protein n=1 Tax=Yersinia mollaretii TaxID=33060 RepID=A0AA36LLD1_YERMO|nr:Uncharacterised protein [Yersinia mollaretii]
MWGRFWDKGEGEQVSVDMRSDQVSVDIRAVLTLPSQPQPRRRAGRPSFTCGLREILPCG